MPPETASGNALREYILSLGIDVVGVADVTRAREGFVLEPRLRSSFDRAIALGKRLVRPVLEDLIDSPTLLYLHHYRQVNYLLDRAALLTAGFIQDRGFRALPIPASQIVNWELQKGHVSHKEIGRLAGLGWIGRNNLLIHPGCGAQWRLVTVLTDMPLDAGAPLENDCGACRRCAAICPASAIKNAREDFDHLACYEKLKEFRRSGLVSQHICGLCVKACRGS